MHPDAAGGICSLQAGATIPAEPKVVDQYADDPAGRRSGGALQAMLSGAPTFMPPASRAEVTEWYPEATVIMTDAEANAEAETADEEIQSDAVITNSTR